MTKKFLSAMMAFAMLFATSCQNDIESFGTSADGTSVVTFSVETPELATRAFSDGTTATVLQYAVYEGETELPDLTKSIANGNAEEINISKKVELQLTTGNTYSVVFWAAAPNAPYTVNFADRTMTVDYAAVCNDENRDAFYARHTFTVNGKQTETVKLYRPFAQLNIGTNDYDASTDAGYTPVNSSVKVKNVYSTLNLFDGTVDGSTEAYYDYNAIPKNETFPVDGYEYLSMNYLLVASEKELVDIEFGYTETDATAGKTRIVGSVPVQRNYRTNIFGQLLTSDVDINIEIVPVYDGAYNNEHLYIYKEGTYYFSTVEGLKFFAQKVNEGDAMWKKANVGLDADIDLGGAEWTPIGTDAIFEGKFDGKGYTVSNFKVTEKEGRAGLFGNVRGTIKNLNVKDVVIEAKHYAGAIVGQGYAKIDNCNVENINITLTTLNNDLGDKAGAIIGQNCEGANMYVKNSTAKNVTIKGYRDLGGIAGMAHRQNTVSGCSVENITIIQDLSVNYQSEIPATLAGVVGRRGANVVYENNKEKNVTIATSVSTAEEFAAIMKLDYANIGVVLANDIEVAISSLGQITGGSGEYKLGGEATENILIDLNGKKLTIATTYWSVLGAKNDNALFTIKNGTMTSSQATGTWNSYDLGFANCNYAIENVTFEKAIALEGANKAYTIKNVTINETHDYYAMWISAKGQTVNIDGLTINSAGRGVKIDEQYVSAPAKVTMNVDNATFTTKKKAAIVVKSVEGAEINWGAGNNIANVAQDDFFAVWVDEDAEANADKVVVNGAYAKVEGSSDVAVETVDALKEALANGSSKIYVGAGEYTFPSSSVKAGVTIECAEGTVFTGNSKLNIKGATVIGATFSNPSGTAVDQTINGTFKGCTFEGTNALRWCYAGETCVFEECVFSGSTYGVHFDGVANNVTFRNCTFSGFNAFAGSAKMVTFDGCTFVGNGKSGYNGANLWGSAKMINCEFTFNGTTANEWIDCIGTDKTYEFENCTVNGAAYDSKDVTGKIFSRNHVTIKINNVDCAM